MDSHDHDVMLTCSFKTQVPFEKKIDSNEILTRNLGLIMSSIGDAGCQSLFN